MSDFLEFKIKRDTLESICDSLRRRFHFTRKLNPAEVPRYITETSEEFFVTHVNEINQGAGCIVNDLSCMENVPWAWKLFVIFVPVEYDGAAVNPNPNCYKIANIYDYLDAQSESDAVAITSIPYRGFMYVLNRGNDAENSGDGIDYRNAAVNAMIERVRSWSYNQQFIISGLEIDKFEDYGTLPIPTTTPSVFWYEDNYVCTSTIHGLNAETITVDGELTDDGWLYGGWYSVSSSSGRYRIEPTGSEALRYRYKIRTDANNLYIGLSSNVEPYTGFDSKPKLEVFIAGESTGKGGAYKYKYITTYTAEGQYNLYGYKNMAASGESLSLITTGGQVAWLGDMDNNLTRIEMRIPLSEFNGTDVFRMIVGFSCPTHVYGEYLTLYSHKIDYLPEERFDFSNNLKVIPANEQIGSDDIIAALEEVL